MRCTVIPYAPGLWRRPHEAVLGLRSSRLPPAPSGRYNPHSYACSQKTSLSLQPPFLEAETNQRFFCCCCGNTNHYIQTPPQRFQKPQVILRPNIHQVGEVNLCTGYLTEFWLKNSPTLMSGSCVSENMNCLLVSINCNVLPFKCFCVGSSGLYKMIEMTNLFKGLAPYFFLLCENTRLRKVWQTAQTTADIQTHTHSICQYLAVWARPSPEWSPWREQFLSRVRSWSLGLWLWREGGTETCGCTWG